MHCHIIKNDKLRSPETIIHSVGSEKTKLFLLLLCRLHDLEELDLRT